MYNYKYYKYKNKYNQLFKKLYGGSNPHILEIDKSNFIDTMGINKEKYYDYEGLHVSKLTPEHILWHSYENQKLSDIPIQLGSIYDKNKDKPIWFSGPEVCIIYNTKKNIIKFLRKISSNYYEEYSSLSDYSKIKNDDDKKNF